MDMQAQLDRLTARTEAYEYLLLATAKDPKRLLQTLQDFTTRDQGMALENGYPFDTALRRKNECDDIKRRFERALGVVAE